MPRQITDLIKNATAPFEHALIADIEVLLREKYCDNVSLQNQIYITALYGDSGVILNARVGNKESAHLFELACEHMNDPGIDGALGVLVDYLDGILAEFYKEKGHRWLPLDYTARPFENHTIFVKHTYRNFALENAADIILKDQS